MSTFTPPGLPAYQAQQAAASSAAVQPGINDAFSFGDFFGGVLETASAFGTSLLQQDLFRDQLKTQAQINAITQQQAASGNRPATQSGASGGGISGFFADPQTLVIVAVVVVVVILLLARRK